MGNDLLLEAYRRAGIAVDPEPVPVEVAPAGESTAPLTEAEIERFALARAGIVANEK